MLPRAGRTDEAPPESVDMSPTRSEPRTRKEDNGFLSSQSSLRARALIASCLCFAPVVLVACEEQSPVGIGDGVLPGEPVTVEVTIPWSQFADSLLKNANFEGAFADPREALQAWAIAKKVEQEEVKRRRILAAICPAYFSRASSHGFNLDDILENLGQRKNR